jgi:hypothetical protein
MVPARIVRFTRGYCWREEPCTDPYARFCGQTGAAAPSGPIDDDCATMMGTLRFAHPTRMYRSHAPAWERSAGRSSGL